MALTFQKGTKLLLTDGVNRYTLLVNSATASQTYVESSQSVKTLHAPTLVSRTFVTEKSTASLSFTCYVSDGISESILLEWFGLVKDTDKYRIQPTPTTEALTGSKEKLDIYIISDGTIYKLDTCIGQNISFQMSRKELLQLSITGVAKDLIEVNTLPTVGNLYAQTNNFYNGTIVIPDFDGISSVTCELTREVNWLNQKSLFNLNEIYTADTPILNSFAISGSITKAKRDNNKTYKNSTLISISYGDTFKINLDSCNTTDRWGMESIHTVVTDYKLLPSSVDAYITF